jgi:hypothetical protein
MVLQSLLISENLTLFFAVTPFMQFVVMLCLALVMFIIAVARQTIGACLLSSFMWLAMTFVTYATGDWASGLTQGSALTFLLLFFVMFALTIKSLADKLAEVAGEKQRKIEEEIVL